METTKKRITPEDVFVPDSCEVRNENVNYRSRFRKTANLEK
jgi:hypothetical protein